MKYEQTVSKDRKETWNMHKQSCRTVKKTWNMNSLEGPLKKKHEIWTVSQDRKKYDMKTVSQDRKKNDIWKQSRRTVKKTWNMH